MKTEKAPQVREACVDFLFSSTGCLLQLVPYGTILNWN
jgi:hypothetical protein